MNGCNLSEEGGEIAAALDDQIFTIFLGPDPVVLETLVEIFPHNVFEGEGEGVRVRDDI